MPAAWAGAAVAAVGVANQMGAFGGGGGGGGGSSGGSSSTYDPYASYRPAAAEKLNSLLENPSQAMSQPGFQQQLKVGSETTQRAMAKSGMLQSGAEQVALQDVGMNTFSQYYNSMLANYAQFSGATQNPAAAALAQQQGASLSQNRLYGNVNQIAGGLGAIANQFRSPSGYGTNSNNTDYFGGSGGGWSSQTDYGSGATSASDFYGGTYDSGAGWSA